MYTPLQAVQCFNLFAFLRKDSYKIAGLYPESQTDYFLLIQNLPASFSDLQNLEKNYIIFCIIFKLICYIKTSFEFNTVNQSKCNG